MKKKNTYAYLGEIGNILNKEKICSDITPINAIIGNAPKKGGYNLEKLKLRIKSVPNNTRPSGVKLLDVLLTVEIHEQPLGNDINYPITKYNFLIEIIGKNKENENVHTSFHLDFDNGADSQYIHPSFHLTYGGRTMMGTDLGNVLLLPSPRISHPPMDAILGIDFILSNFLLKTDYLRIKSNSQYKAAVRNSQERLWKPYMLTIANHWCKCTQHSINDQCKEFFPTLID